MARKMVIGFSSLRRVQQSFFDSTRSSCYSPRIIASGGNELQQKIVFERSQRTSPTKEAENMCSVWRASQRLPSISSVTENKNNVFHCFHKKHLVQEDRNKPHKNLQSNLIYWISHFHRAAFLASTADSASQVPMTSFSRRPLAAELSR